MSKKLYTGPDNNAYGNCKCSRIVQSGFHTDYLTTCSNIDIASGNQPPSLHVGGVKMRERNKMHHPLKVINHNKTNDSNKNEDEDKMIKGNVRRKVNRKIIRAGSLVRK